MRRQNALGVRVRTALWVSAAALGLATGACGSGMTTGIVRSASYETYRAETEYRRQLVATPKVLEEPPAKPYVIVATLEVRTSRVKNMEELGDQLTHAARSVAADAIIPPATAPISRAQASINPLRRYYVFDDGRTQVLEAHAIRFPPDDDERLALEAERRAFEATRSQKGLP